MSLNNLQNDATKISRIGIKRADLFELLPDRLRTDVSQSVRRRKFTAGEVIYSQGSVGTEMYRIIAGQVRLYYLSEDGREFIHVVYEKGDCFGISSLIDGEPRAQMAQAQCDGILEVLSLETFNAFRLKDPAFDRAVMLMLIGDVRILIGRVNSVAFEPLTSRLAWRLIKFSEEDRSGALTVKLSQTELAAMVDASRQRVNTILGEFQKEGLVCLKYAEIVILNRTELSRKIIKP